MNVMILTTIFSTATRTIEPRITGLIWWSFLIDTVGCTASDQQQLSCRLGFFLNLAIFSNFIFTTFIGELENYRSPRHYSFVKIVM